MFFFGGRNRCVGGVRGRVSVLLATGENKRGDGSTVKRSAQENGTQIGGGGLVGLAQLRVKTPRRLPAQSRCASAFGAALTSSGEVTLDALAAYRFCSHLWVLARCPNDLVCPQSRLPMPRMLFNKGLWATVRSDCVETAPHWRIHLPAPAQLPPGRIEQLQHPLPKTRAAQTPLPAVLSIFADLSITERDSQTDPGSPLLPHLFLNCSKRAHIHIKITISMNSSTKQPGLRRRVLSDHQVAGRR